jgi:hypothetical protein
MSGKDKKLKSHRVRFSSGMAVSDPIDHLRPLIWREISGLSSQPKTVAPHPKLRETS